MRDCIHIWMWGREIGSLMWREGRNSSYFVYHPDYLSDPLEPFPLVAPKTRALNKAFANEDKRMYQHLPAFLADSLPDDWGNALFAQWQVEQKLSASQVTPLDKLTFIGSRGMGALEFVPDAQLKPRFEKIDIASLAQLAQKIFVDREKAIIEPSETLTKKLLMTVGTSAGGRKPKAIIAVNRSTGEIRSGQIAGLEEYDYYILKFGDKERSSAELEMTYYEMAVAAGMTMMPSRLQPADGEMHFMTQRFDRPNGEKLHMQTLAAIEPDADCYEQLLLVCRTLHLSDAECEEIFRRMVFNHLSNNTDDHNKNFSFLMNRKGEWSLAPAYDLTFIFNVGGFQPHREHCLLMRGKITDWTIEDVLAFARDNGIRNAEKIINQVVASILNFRYIAERNGVKPGWIGCVEECLLSHLREWGFAVPAQELTWTTSSGRYVSKVYLEQAYKGNIHLYATIDGKPNKWIFRPSMPEYALATDYGLSNIPLSLLREWVENRI